MGFVQEETGIPPGAAMVVPRKFQGEHRIPLSEVFGSRQFP